VENDSCLFCSEKRVRHLFFECCVAQVLLESIDKITGNVWVITLNQWLSSDCLIKV
jgi:hypothetical protein